MWNELFSYSKIVIYIYILSLKFLSLTVRTISDDGWNQIQFNLADFTRRAYGTNYVETLRVQIHANCRIRRVYFSDRLYSEDELPAEFKLYLPVSMKRILIEFVWPWYKKAHRILLLQNPQFKFHYHRFNKNSSNSYNNSKVLNSKFLNKLLTRNSKKMTI